MKSKLIGFVRHYGRQVIRGWRRFIGGWNRLPDLAKRLVSRHRERTTIQRALLGVAFLGLLVAVGLRVGWTPGFESDLSNGPSISGDQGAPSISGDQGAGVGSVEQGVLRESAASLPESVGEAEPQMAAATPSPGTRVGDGGLPLNSEMPIETSPKDGLTRPAPTSEPPVAKPTIIDDSLPAVSVSAMQWPVVGSVSRPFGWYRHPVFGDWRHASSVALTADDDLTVHAALAGRVRDVVNSGGLWRVSIEHAGGWTTVYDGLAAVDVKSFEVVQTGEQIGSSPQAAGPSLQFTLLKGDEAVDPSSIVAGGAVSAGTP